MVVGEIKKLYRLTALVPLKQVKKANEYEVMNFNGNRCTLVLFRGVEHICLKERIWLIVQIQGFNRSCAPNILISMR